MGMFAPAAASLLVFVVLPLWIAAGLADYFCHRATRIELTSGASESVLRLVQFVLVGIPVTAAQFLNINAGYFAFALGFLVLHHAVAAGFSWSGCRVRQNGDDHDSQKDCECYEFKSTHGRASRPLTELSISALLTSG